MNEQGKALHEEPADFSERLREVVARSLDDWQELYEAFSPVSIETGELLARRIPPATGDVRQAAVLIPLLMDPEGVEIVYTVRKGHLNDHAGQISFPGGSLEPGDDSLLDAALREAEEEIDLSRDLVEVIGELEEMYIPPSNFRVSPFVGLLPHEAELAIDPREVEEVFTARLADLLSPDTFQKVVWNRDGCDYEVPIFAVEGYEVWGATAAMTAALLARLGWRPPR